MNDIAALEAKYKELGAEIELLKSAKVKEWPQREDKYFCITASGNVDDNFYTEDGYDLGAKTLGNMFRTREDATKELETRKTIAELRAQPGRKKFDASGGDNFSIGVNQTMHKLHLPLWQSCEYGFASTYFESQEAVRNAIKAVGADRILAASKWLSMGE